MKLAIKISLVLTLFFHFGSTAQLSVSEDSIINLLHKLRYNHPDSTYSVVKMKLENAADNKSDFYAELLYLKSSVEYVQSDYVASRNTSEELYSLSKEISNDVGIARALNGRGLIYLGRELYKEALIEFEKALKKNKEIKNHKNIAANLLNIGICHQELGNWNKAYQSYKESLEKSLEYDFEVYVLMDMNRLGTLFLEKNKLDSAEYYLVKVKNRNPNQWEKSYNFSNLTELEFKKGNYIQAIEYGLKSFEIAKGIGAKWDASEVALKLSKAYEELELLNKALEFHKLHKAYSDSL